MDSIDKAGCIIITAAILAGATVAIFTMSFSHGENLAAIAAGLEQRAVHVPGSGTNILWVKPGTKQSDLLREVP